MTPLVKISICSSGGLIRFNKLPNKSVIQRHSVYKLEIYYFGGKRFVPQCSNQGSADWLEKTWSDWPRKKNLIGLTRQKIDRIDLIRLIRKWNLIGLTWSDWQHVFEKLDRIGSNLKKSIQSYLVQSDLILPTPGLNHSTGEAQYRQICQYRRICQ